MVHVCLLRKHNKTSWNAWAAFGDVLWHRFSCFALERWTFQRIIKKFRLQLEQQSLTPLNVFNSSGIFRNTAFCFRRFTLNRWKPLCFNFDFCLNLLLFTWHFEIISMKFHHWFTLFYISLDGRTSFKALKWKLENFIVISTFKCSALKLFTIVSNEFWLWLQFSGDSIARWHKSMN